jgi:lysozyme
MTSMISSLEADLTRDEGTRNRPYLDSRGFHTIGVGHNLDAEGLAPEAIAAQLRHDVLTKALPLYQALPWLQNAPEPVQRALLNMAFNIGIQGLLKFKTTLALIEQGDYDLAADRILKLPYAKQVGSRASRVASLIRKGKGV